MSFNPVVKQGFVVNSYCNCIGDICAPRDAKSKDADNVNASEIGVFSPSKDDDGEANQNPEVGITRLRRVSAQFLPPDGSRIVVVPNGNYRLQYSYLSQRGYYPDALDKANQDSFCIHTPFGTNPNDHFFGVFDGHGEFGAQCSQFVKQKLCENLLRNSRFHVDPVEACHAAFLSTNAQLHADLDIDDSMSGTTAITILVRGKTLYVANSGDSRAVIAERRGTEIVAVDLSIDQTPFREDELERVKLCGARVLTLDQIEGLKNPDVQCWGTEEGDDGDPPRLWVPNGMYPGTAFTRSIGDSIAETIGVVANPEIVALDLTPEHLFFVIASDGVFEFLSSQAVVDMVSSYTDPRDACAAIVAESYRLWLQYETRTDDITVIVVQISGLTGATVGQAAISGTALRPPIPQVVELSGSESPTTMSWHAKNQRARTDISKTRLRAIESSLENGQVWVPPSPGHRKTWEEEAHIERALNDHFLFRKLTDSQCHVLLDCMKRVEVQAGETVVKQGGEGDCFYVVGSGEFEVFATQETTGAVPRVLQRYTADKLSSFGELALMYNKPLQASVRAVTNGTLWALRREDFRGILTSEFSNLSSLKLLRSVDLLSRLTILQLSLIADTLSEVSFSNGQTIVTKGNDLLGLYMIQKGKVRISFNSYISSENASSLMSDIQKMDEESGSGTELSMEKNEGSYFGEWTLLGERIDSLNVVALGDVVCAVLTKEKFESVVGPLTKILQDGYRSRETSSDFPREPVRSIDASLLSKVQLSDLEWKTCLYSTDCCEIGLVQPKDSEHLFSLKRFSKQKLKKLGKEEQVLKEKQLFKEISASGGVPQVLCTCADRTHVGILLNTIISCPIASILHSPLDEHSARFCAASVVVALEDLHKAGILYRGVSPEVVMFAQTGHVQLVDFRFGKKLSSERTFTICGMVDSLAPEIVQAKGHGFAADWWALGVLIYFMLQSEMPFGSWRQNELDTFAKIAKGQFTLPETFSPEVVDLITKLLVVDEKERLGSEGVDSVKSHMWFNGVNWESVKNGSCTVPQEILTRIDQYLETRPADISAPDVSTNDDVDELNTPEWLEDW
ncbi:putative cGMP-dependent protein kinase AGC-PKA-PKG family [Helianthus debilis subsp. tardiflorus]